MRLGVWAGWTAAWLLGVFGSAWATALVPAWAQSGGSGLEAAAALEKVLVESIQRAERSVVAIARVRTDGPEQGWGLEVRPDPFGGRRLLPSPLPKPTDPDFVPNEYASGVVVDRRGLVLTVYHVLGEKSDYYLTTHDRRVFRGKLIGADPRSDLAVLSLANEGLGRGSRLELPVIRLGDASTLKKGQIVIALGNPYAIARDGQPSASWGIVANLGRKAPAVPDPSEPTGKPTIHHFGTLIQTDARLNQGTSGGPLLNLQGEMVGLTTTLAMVPGYEEVGGYAIPVDATFHRALEALKQGREVEYGFLGVRLAVPGLENGEAGGARVERVEPGLPAARAGLQPKDLITSVNGVPVLDADGLVREIGKLPVESVVRLGVLRGRQTLHLEVGLTKYRVRGQKIVTAPPPSWRGIRVDYPTAVCDLYAPGYAGNPLLGETVAVAEVQQGSPGWQAGLRVGMLVSHVGRTPVRTPKQFHEAVAGRTGPVDLRLVGPAADKPLRTVLPGT
ncbi:MAG: trypsin-like peptidase domain-containing protein [Thermoguttaceae bacterium]